MSDEPQHLDRLNGMLRSMARLVKGKRRSTPGARRVSYTMNPRQACDVCNTLFDYAICPAQMPAMSRCGECKQKLADGYTALISPSGGYAFVKAATLKPGEVVKISDDVFEKVLARKKQQEGA